MDIHTNIQKKEKANKASKYFSKINEKQFKNIHVNRR